MPGNEGARLQRSLGDAEQDRRARGRLFAPSSIRSFIASSSISIDLFARQIIGIARIGDIDLLQHLPDDDFNVLVIDVHALQPIDFLDLIDEIGGELFDALDRQNVMRRRIAVDDVIALSTMSPSWRWMCLPFGIRYSIGSAPSSCGTMEIRVLFL